MPICSPATLAGLTVYPPASQHGVFSARVGVVQKQKNPARFSHAGLLVLATSYSRAACRRTTIGAAAFHFRVRNGNGWCHCAIVTRVRSRTGGFAAFAAMQARGRISGDFGRFGQSSRLKSVSKNSQHLTDSLASTYGQKKRDSRFVTLLNRISASTL